jgi:hypothetical protein
VKEEIRKPFVQWVGVLHHHLPPITFEADSSPHQMVLVSYVSRNAPTLILECSTHVIVGKFSHNMTTIDTGYDTEFGADGEQ